MTLESDRALFEPVLANNINVMVSVNTGCKGVKLPECFYKWATFNFELGEGRETFRWLAEQGIEVNLVFEEDEVNCFIPWDSIKSMVPVKSGEPVYRKPTLRLIKRGIYGY